MNKNLEKVIIIRKFHVAVTYLNCVTKIKPSVLLLHDINTNHLARPEYPVGAAVRVVQGTTDCM